MGYFPNGTAGCAYEEKWCVRCIHYDDKPACAVWELHLFMNYEECNNDKSPLHVLIPRGESCDNLRCRMFKPKEVMKRRPVAQRPKGPDEML